MVQAKNSLGDKGGLKKGENSQKKELGPKCRWGREKKELTQKAREGEIFPIGDTSSGGILTV